MVAQTFKVALSPNDSKSLNRSVDNTHETYSSLSGEIPLVSHSDVTSNVTD